MPGRQAADLTVAKRRSLSMNAVKIPYLSPPMKFNITTMQMPTKHQVPCIHIKNVRPRSNAALFSRHHLPFRKAKQDGKIVQHHTTTPVEAMKGETNVHYYGDHGKIKRIVHRALTNAPSLVPGLLRERAVTGRDISPRLSNTTRRASNRSAKYDKLSRLPVIRQSPNLTRPLLTHVRLRLQHVHVLQRVFGTTKSS